MQETCQNLLYAGHNGWICWLIKGRSDEGIGLFTTGDQLVPFRQGHAAKIAIDLKILQTAQCGAALAVDYVEY